MAQSSTAAKGAQESTSSLSALRSLKEKRKRSGIGWDDCNSQMMQEMIQSVTSTGALVSFSFTSDQGAVALFIKDGDEGEHFYAGNHEELEQLLLDVHSQYHE